MNQKIKNRNKLQQFLVKVKDKKRVLKLLSESLNYEPMTSSRSAEPTVRDVFARRHRDGETNIQSIDKYFNTLEDEVRYIASERLNFQTFSNLAIDGVSCCFKTTILQSYETFKINSILGGALKSYNVCADVALNYLVQATRAMETSHNLLFDRSPLANVAFQLTYYLMDRMLDERRLTCHAMCQEYVNMHHLVPALEYQRARHFNVLILLDSDYNEWKNRMIKRGSANDIVKSLLPAYHAAQNAAYSYISVVLNYPCIDLDWLRQRSDVIGNVAGTPPFNDRIIRVIREIIDKNISQTKIQYPNVIQHNPRYINTMNDYVNILNISNR